MQTRSNRGAAALIPVAEVCGRQHFRLTTDETHTFDLTLQLTTSMASTNDFAELGRIFVLHYNTDKYLALACDRTSSRRDGDDIALFVDVNQAKYLAIDEHDLQHARLCVFADDPHLTSEQRRAADHFGKKFSIESTVASPPPPAVIDQLRYQVRDARASLDDLEAYVASCSS